MVYFILLQPNIEASFEKKNDQLPKRSLHNLSSIETIDHRVKYL